MRRSLSDDLSAGEEPSCPRPHPIDPVSVDAEPNRQAVRGNFSTLWTEPATTANGRPVRAGRDTLPVTLVRPAGWSPELSALAAAYAPTDALKARGAFYTPPSLASFLTRWAIRDADDRTLEPACGDGAFIDAAVKRYRDLGRTELEGHLFGVELESSEAEKARRLAPDARILTADFFEVAASQFAAVDAVIGNPPYIRYHGFTGEQRIRGLARAKEQGVALSNLASSWAHFVAHSAAFLRPGGRLALVLPAELLHTDYAAPVRSWLLERFPSVVVVTFDRMAFADAEVDALLLLASDDDASGLRVARVPNAGALDTFELLPALATASRSAPIRWSGTVDRDAGELYAELLVRPGARRLGDVASVDIGVVTGANRFFVADAKEAARLGLPPSQLLPIIESASAVAGLAVRSSQMKRLLRIDREPRSRSLLRYLADGEAAGVAQGYKCRTRSPWYRVPLPKVKPDAFLPYMNHHAPRLLVNRPRAWSTNLLHGVKLRRGAPDVRAISVAMLSATVMLSAEIEGRAYGGGVLKLETKEAERLLLPTWDASIEEKLVGAFRDVDRLVREGQMEAASALADAALSVDHERYRRAYQVFRQRRLQRKNGNGH